MSDNNKQIAHERSELKTKYILTGPIDLLMKSYEVYKWNFWRYLGMVAVPLLAVIPIVAIILMPQFSGVGGNEAVALMLGFFGLVLVALLFYLVISSQIGLYLMIRDHDENISIKHALSGSSKYFWSYIIVGIAVGIFSLLWSLFFIVPGIIVMIYYSLTTWVLIYEDYQGMAALKRSKELIKGYWWAVFGRIIALQLILMAIMLVFEVASSINDTLHYIWINYLSSIFSFVLMPLFLLYMCYIYWDLKRIKGESQVDRSKKGYGYIALGGFLLFALITVLLIIIFSLGLTNLMP